VVWVRDCRITIVSHSPGLLTPQQWETLNGLLEGMSPEQILWASGYLAGYAEARRKPAGVSQNPAALTESPPETTILYGSQTGNAEKTARRLRERLAEAGLPVKVEGMDSYPPARLKRERCLLLVVSTHGEGEPPDNARGFHEFLHGRKAPRLEGLRFAVLALGDTSYEHFCKTGRDFDSRLAELGAIRLHARADCDVDFEDCAEAWMDGVLGALASQAVPRVEALEPAAASAAMPAYSRRNPFPAVLLDNIPLTGRGSTKEVRHIELSIADSGLVYAPGDSLGVLPSNWPERVADLLASLGLAADAPVPGSDGAEIRLEEALLHHYEITTPTRPFLEKYAELAESRDLADLLRDENREQLRDYLRGREIIDIVHGFPVRGLTAGQFVGLLRKLPPRLYSIASSYQASPDEVHLTVGVVRYESHGRERRGVASTFLADRVAEDLRVPVYVHGNPNFRLPEDPDTPIVMVGPGTGVAPFRAFVADREAVGAGGRNWLFFGDRNFRTDFLYQREWLEHRRKGLLSRIDVAFSRDEADKLYVQHRMLDQSRELYAWLEEGAHFYVCGDAERMAADVHEALVAVVEKESGLGRERAEDYVKELQSSKRYQRDVY
jgi:sulfite reductase (NADPH) flavoprotein alpha-component